MRTSKQDIQCWFENGLKKKVSHMIIVCDTFDWEDYPVYVDSPDKVQETIDEYNGKNMQRLMEVYDLNQDMEEQLNSTRVWNVPK